ncbi:MAG: helix-turn-helix transcriptional regulator [Clostridia bacterium]|nr:helix-turn-helix transcriptional regulator [Clostridia bacterium]
MGMKIINKFSERLKQLRLEKEIGQIALAKQLGVSKGIISLWENGLREPTLSNLIARAQIF